MRRRWVVVLLAVVIERRYFSTAMQLSWICIARRCDVDVDLIETLEVIRGTISHRSHSLTLSFFLYLFFDFFLQIESISFRFTRDLEEYFNCINYGDGWMANSQGGRQVSDWFSNKCSQSHFNTAMCQWWESRIAHSRLKNILIHLFSPFWITSQRKHVKWLLFLCFLLICLHIYDF